mmetsp:Transcript_100983/g.195327  ORF Transcript_100983/g.195327 Transcript_100983/m.195327 type:complete len:88 (+) Transcript_100983:189-452(+)
MDDGATLNNHERHHQCRPKQVLEFAPSPYREKKRSRLGLLLPASRIPLTSRSNMQITSIQTWVLTCAAPSKVSTEPSTGPSEPGQVQ